VNGEPDVEGPDVEMPDAERTVRRILGQARVVAVLGAHVRRHKPAFYVPEYLFEHGFRILPVNPVFAGEVQWDEAFVGRLSELEAPVDVVNVFRRSSRLPEHVDEILGLDPLPRWAWFQLGVRHDGVAARLREEGIEVIQDRCMLADHRRFLL
jgi:predicted CoA-binding protein